MKKIKRFLKKLWGNRPFRTFMQGFLGTFAGATLMDLQDITLVKSLVISGIMAGLSALMMLDKGEE